MILMYQIMLCFSAAVCALYLVSSGYIKLSPR
ncbi:TPA: DUF1378 family protein [Escherichia coli]|nr:DUF1378 family protein [Escherichia coli]HAV8306397.1 DUF1378 family protein [Escherichia coli]HAV8329096.1 DUF1378 family protein [Escherichia coli]HAW0754702.1 DUF1378 family protein [Escherichia coli]HAW2732561.1 DUF1378 family protein [Escherichia coli]